ncbi:MAG: elongation factor Ts [Candidatus Omnitrophica bacterium]|jgi:elongation factor Ts|nr:elongation factor Ts [Candidatus Omnitrophota bacterium]MDD5079853.1 elongation factor Ts [Candidatus Omnitrophota bacterium]
MEISVSLIKELRELSAASISDCKKVLVDAKGDIKKAMGLLRKRGLEKSASKKDRASKEGRVDAYLHTGNKIGVLIEVDSETDFVAKNEAFAQFTKDLAMQIAACNPAYIKREDVPAELIEQDTDKDKELFYKNNCLLDQVFVKDPSMTVKDYLGSLVVKFNENIVIRRFIRYKIGE